MTIRRINVTTGAVTVYPDAAPAFVTPAGALALARAAAAIPRDQFLLGLVGMGIITEAIAEEAATGAWPAAFDAFLSGLSAGQRITAKATWADGRDVRRTNSILLLIAADQGVTDVQLDTLFGIAP